MWNHKLQVHVLRSKVVIINGGNLWDFMWRLNKPHEARTDFSMFIRGFSSCQLLNHFSIAEPHRRRHHHIREFMWFCVIHSWMAVSGEIKCNRSERESKAFSRYLDNKYSRLVHDEWSRPGKHSAIHYKLSFIYDATLMMHV